MASFPTVRMRRTRQNEKLRGLVRETHLNVEQLIYPLFIAEGLKEPNEVASMPGIMQWPLEQLGREVERVADLGIPAVLLFGPPEQKDEVGSEAGADIVAPSDMMDGRVGAIRHTLDEHGLSGTPIMAYSAKFASGFYGPFREAAGSAPRFGDRRAYQMDPANAREALREIDLDIAEGADIVMVKPAMAYMDVIRRVRDHCNLPIAAYNVSGEYAMIKAAAHNGWIDERRIVMEVLTGIRRAGADMIITYFAPDVARWLKEE